MGSRPTYRARSETDRDFASGSERQTGLSQQLNEVGYAKFSVKALCFKCEEEMIITMNDDRNFEFRCLRCGNEFGVKLE